MILRSNSHRAAAKLRLMFPDAVNLYTWDEGAKFYEVPDGPYTEHARKITGITKARNQNRADYAKTWSSR